MTLLRLLLLFVLALSYAPNNSVRSQTCTECDTCFYHVFTKSWVHTTCKLEDKSQNESNTKECRQHADLPTNITIHGLWPQITSKDTVLGYCKNNPEKFDESKLTSIKPQLAAMWPTAFITGTDASFWVILNNNYNVRKYDKNNFSETRMGQTWHMLTTYHDGLLCKIPCPWCKISNRSMVM